MNELPAAVSQILIQRVLNETSAAWLLIDPDGKLKDMGGSLSAFGLDGVKKGCVIRQQAVFLDGILSTHHFPDSIDNIQLDNGEHADIYLLEEDEERWILLFDRTESSKWKGLAQQKANELELLQQQKQSTSADECNFSTLMGILVLELNSDGSFKVLEPIPDDFDDIYPQIKNQSSNLNPDKDFPFLANFLEDCQIVWESKENERMKSGPWIELNKMGEEYVLEATAILWQQRKILMIEHLNGEYKQHHAILQLGRENVLTKQKLEKEIVRQKIMEQSLIEARAKADKANQAKSEFLSSMSHEFRTPLNAILGFSQLLLTDPDARFNAEQRENLGHIQSGGTHLLELISQVLELSNIESGRMDVSIEDVSINDVIKACLPIVQVLADRRQITISHENINTVIRADFMRMKQVVFNLLSNAIKYNKEGGSVIIEKVITQEGRFRLLFKDTGIGIPKNKRDKLFVAFSRLGQENSGIEGTGVGLVVTKTIVKAMNGHIGFKSDEGEGSVFWVEFPVAVAGNND